MVHGFRVHTVHGPLDVEAGTELAVVLVEILVCNAVRRAYDLARSEDAILDFSEASWCS